MIFPDRSAGYPALWGRAFRECPNMVNLLNHYTLHLHNRAHFIKILCPFIPLQNHAIQQGFSVSFQGNASGSYKSVI